LGGTKSFRAQAAEFFFRNRVGHPAPCKGVHTLKINYTKCGPHGAESRSRPKICWAKYAAIEAESKSEERKRSSVATRRMRGRRGAACLLPRLPACRPASVHAIVPRTAGYGRLPQPSISLHRRDGTFFLLREIDNKKRNSDE
jgi:hypothetical protein